MQLFTNDSDSELLSKIKIIVRIRPTLSGEEKKEFIQMIDVRFVFTKNTRIKIFREIL